MNQREFSLILNERLNKIIDTLESKGKEYASDDRLYNFKRAAQEFGETPEIALFGMLKKHLVSVIDLIEGRLPLSQLMINEKIGDSINYLILLEALLKEKLIKDFNEFGDSVNKKKRKFERK